MSHPKPTSIERQPINYRKSSRLGWALLFSCVAITGKSLAADGNIVTDLNLDHEEIAAPPSNGHYQVDSNQTETVLVQSQPGDSTKKEIVLTGKDDGSGAKKLTFNYPTPVGGVVNVDVEFTIRQMGANTDGPDVFSNVWSFIFNLGSNNLIFTIGSGEGDKRMFALAGVKDAQGQPVGLLHWSVGETYKIRFAFNFITQKLDVILNGTPWIKNAALPVSPSPCSGLGALRIGDGQTVGGVAKHPSQLAISSLIVNQP